MCSKICLVANLQRASYVITKHFSTPFLKKKRDEFTSMHGLYLSLTHTHSDMLIIIFQAPYPTAIFLFDFKQWVRIISMLLIMTNVWK